MSVSFASDLTLTRLRDVVAGRDRTFPRVHAMNLLLDSDFPNRHRDLEAVLANQAETPRIRYVAAELIGRVDTGATRAILTRALADKNETVQEAVVTALGYTGGAAELEALRAFRKTASGLAAARAAFSSVIITHRLGLEGDDLDPSPDSEILELVPGAARPIDISPADPEDAQACIRNLRRQPMGVEYDEKSVHTIRCGRNLTRMLWNREFTGKFAELIKRKTLMGVWAGRNDSTKVDFVSGLFFAAPGRTEGTLHLYMHKVSGARVFYGTASAASGGLKFELRAVKRPGGFAATIPGELREGGRMTFASAVGSQFVEGRRAPSLGMGP